MPGRWHEATPDEADKFVELLVAGATPVDAYTNVFRVDDLSPEEVRKAAYIAAKDPVVLTRMHECTRQRARKPVRLEIKVPKFQDVLRAEQDKREANRAREREELELQKHAERAVARMAKAAEDAVIAERADQAARLACAELVVAPDEATAAKLAGLTTLNQQIVVRRFYSVEHSMAELDEALEFAREKRNPVAMARVIELRMKLYGLGIADAVNPADRQLECDFEEAEKVLKMIRERREQDQTTKS